MLPASPEYVLRAHAIESAIARTERARRRPAALESEPPAPSRRTLPVVSLCAGMVPAAGPSCC